MWLGAQQPVLLGKEGEGLLCALFCWDLGCCEQAWGQPSASTSPPWAAVQKGGDGHRGRVAPSGPGMGHPCAGRRGSSAVLGMPEPRPPCGTGWPLRDVAPLCPVGRAHPLGDEGLFGAPSVGGLRMDLSFRPQGWGAGAGRVLCPWLPGHVSHSSPRPGLPHQAHHPRGRCPSPGPPCLLQLTSRGYRSMANPHLLDANAVGAPSCVWSLEEGPCPQAASLKTPRQSLCHPQLLQEN